MKHNTHVHLDIVGGIAGDMFVSAILDTFDLLQPKVFDAIAKVLPSKAGKPKLESGINSGISGLRFSLEPVSTEQPLTQHMHSDTHQHPDETTYRALCKRLTDSDLTKEVVNIAIALFTIIGKAEAKIHQVKLDQVHFHELADWDSLMDVVAIATILEHLSGCNWSISKLPLGSGLIQTQHGLIPSPSPATAEILKGFEFFNDEVPGERITPTGAAILRFLLDNGLITSYSTGELVDTGYGLGSKTFKNMPNILRVMTFETNHTHVQEHVVICIEFDIDDMTAEELALSLDILRQHESVIDIVVQSARGKKNRGVELVKVMASTRHYQQVIEQCFIQTSTIGLRYRFESRQCLSRSFHADGDNGYKSVVRPDNQSTAKFEHDQLQHYSTLKQRRAIKYKVELSADEGHKQ